MIRFPFEIATTIPSQGTRRPHKGVCYHVGLPELIEMKRLLVLASVLAVAAPLAAASVGGRVNFIMKRGQTPVVNETVVWLEPASGKAAPRPPAKFQMTTRGKTLLPHVLAVPIGSTLAVPHDHPISHHPLSPSSASTLHPRLYRHGSGQPQKVA